MALLFLVFLASAFSADAKLFDTITKPNPLPDIPKGQLECVRTELNKIDPTETLPNKLVHVTDAQRQFWDNRFSSSGDQVKIFMEFIYTASFYLYEQRDKFVPLEQIMIQELRWYVHVLTTFEHVTNLIYDVYKSRDILYRYENLVGTTLDDKARLLSLLKYLQVTYELAVSKKYYIIDLLRQVNQVIEPDGALKNDDSVKETFNSLMTMVWTDYIADLDSGSPDNKATKALLEEQLKNKKWDWNVPGLQATSDPFNNVRGNLDTKFTNLKTARKGFSIAKTVGIVFGLGIIICVCVFLHKVQQKLQTE